MPAGWVILDAIILISSVIAATALSSAYMSNIVMINDMQRAQAGMIAERVSTSLLIIATNYVAGQGLLELYVKNTGSIDIGRGSLGISEVFLQSSSFFQVYTYSEGGGQGTWSYQILNDVNGDGKWGRGETIVLSIRLSSPLGAGTYLASFVLHNGVKAEATFSV